MLWPSAINRVPGEMVLTNREVLLFVYGLASGGERDVPRSAYRECWDRGETYTPAGDGNRRRPAAEVPAQASDSSPAG